MMARVDSAVIIAVPQSQRFLACPARTHTQVETHWRPQNLNFMRFEFGSMSVCVYRKIPKCDVLVISTLDARA